MQRQLEVTTHEPSRCAIRIPKETLTDLRERLARVRWPDAVPDSGWRFGTALGYLRELVEHWRDRYDWRVHEATLNRFRNFTVNVSGTELHYIEEPGVGPDPMPLLLLHGWPGSVWDFHKLIPLLTDPVRFGAAARDAFTVVAPSLPGFGFSFHPRQRRLDRTAMAGALETLMSNVLGHRRYAVHGEDVGAQVAMRMAAAKPPSLHGIHLSDIGLPELELPERPTFEELRDQDQLQGWLSEETGYQWIQGTRPQTLAYGLTDSPVGLAAWLVEKYRGWSDCGDELEQCLTKDELLTAVMLYWVTGSINSSFWPDYASRHGDWSVARGPRIEVPTAYVDFPCAPTRPARSLAERVLNIRRWTTMPRGGHFAALERPEAMAADLRSFFRAFREEEVTAFD